MNSNPDSNSTLPDQTEPIEPQVTFMTAARKPWMTYTIIGITVFIFLFQMAIKASTEYDLVAFLGAKINENILQGEVWRFFTPILIHASLVHLAINMYSLYIMGRILEEHYGHGRLLVLYLLGAFSGNVISFWMTQSPSYGSATALFALVSAEAVFVIQNRFLFGDRIRQILMNISLIIAINLSLSLFLKVEAWGLVGGLMGGLAFSWLGGPEYVILGKPPKIFLVDHRRSYQTWLIGLAVFVFTAILAALRFIMV